MGANDRDYWGYDGRTVMAGIYMICFIVFPIAVFANASKVLCSKNEFLNRQDANVVKGIATCFVMLAHLTIYLENIGGGATIY